MTFKVIRGQGQGQEMTSVHSRDYFCVLGFFNKKAVLSQRLPCDARDRTIQYTMFAARKSFVPSGTDCWAVRAKNKAKTAISVVVEAKPEVEIWRRPKKSKER